MVQVDRGRGVLVGEGDRARGVGPGTVEQEVGGEGQQVVVVVGERGFVLRVP